MLKNCERRQVVGREYGDGIWEERRASCTRTKKMFYLDFEKNVISRILFDNSEVEILLREITKIRPEIDLTRVMN